MKKLMLGTLLLIAAALTGGCSTAQAQCPGGNCSRGWGVWSPWVGGYYYTSPCSGGKCRTAAKPAEPEAVPEESKVEEPAEPELVSIPAADADTLEFKPFCLRVAELINAQRASLGLPALELDRSLCDGCGRHSTWMASGGGFRHAYYSGGRECIAYGVRTPESVVNLWLGSSGHRAIILGGGKTLGVGCSGSYWTLRVR